MFSNFKNPNLPELSEEDMREVESRLKKNFTDAEDYAIRNSGGLRSAVEFIKKRHNGISISLFNLYEPLEK